MKKPIAILLLLILILNFYGYRLLVGYVKQQQAASMEAKVDRRDYQQQDLISIKTKLDLPYYTGSAEFERVYGSINLNGVEHEYVMRRVLNDTLELLCLPDPVGTALKSVEMDLARTSLEGQLQPAEKKSPPPVKISFPDFCQEAYVFSFICASSGKTDRNGFPVSGLPDPLHMRAEHPPQSMHVII